jgi:UDP-N-acetylmuramoylalanine--D-glutamate ligase
VPGLITILGGGESGTGAAILARAQGFDVFVSDKSPLKPEFRKLLADRGIPFEEGQHTEARILESEQVIKSPGIPDKVPLLGLIKAKGIPVVSEIEFAARYTNAKKICITGSNGKTTTTLLTHHILKIAGLRVGLAGNVGRSFALQVAEQSFDYYVLELSSFQLDDMFDFRAEIAVLTNITPDHLDRYEYNMENYVNSKFRILQNQTPEDAFIFNMDDPETIKGLERHHTPARLYPISIKGLEWPEGQEGAYVHEPYFTINTYQNPFTMKITELALQGKHNLANSMAAGVAARILDLRKEVVRESLEHFENIEHRLEHVAKVHGITFINDSKATNVNSTWYALESMDRPVIWVAGGQDKGNDYNELLELVKMKVKAIICLTTDSSKIRNAFSGVVDTIIDTNSAEQAVRVAYELGREGDAVLLSPACASFDLFENYEDRGRQFKNAVRSL